MIKPPSAFASDKIVCPKDPQVIGAQGITVGDQEEAIKDFMILSRYISHGHLFTHRYGAV